MSELTLWDRLAILDGVCKHVWRESATVCEAKIKPKWTCPQCWKTCCDKGDPRRGYQSNQGVCLHERGDLPLVGDGRNEERYNNLDALLGENGLTRRLGLSAWLHVYPTFAAAWCKEEGSEQLVIARHPDPRLALATVVVKAGEVRHET